MRNFAIAAALGAAALAIPAAAQTVTFSGGLASAQLLAEFGKETERRHAVLKPR